MSQIIELNPEVLEPLVERFESEQIIKGLSRKEIGFLISTPDSGKGYLSLSIAYELATMVPLVGLSTGDKPMKTLYWSCEDANGATAKRVLKHFSEISEEHLEQIRKNVHLYGNDSPICCAQKLLNTKAGVEAEEAKSQLIDILSEYDLLIIDTLREAIGTASEVEDDRLVKLVLKEIAEQADVAILAVHHLTKAATKGQEAITSVSASGFSTTLATSRLQLLLEKVQKRTGSITKLSHIKGNNLNEVDKFKDKPLYWSATSLVHADELSVNQLQSEQKVVKAKKPKIVIAEDDFEDPPIQELEPKTTFLAEANIPDEIMAVSREKNRAQIERNEKEKEEYAAWLAKQK